MARMRGHARRRKTRLTHQSLSAVMDIHRKAAPAVDAAREATSLDAVELNILELLRSEPDIVAMPAAYNDAASIFEADGLFPTERYVLGLLVCAACRNEVVYYQRREVLSDGYHFRCRVCQNELLATID